MLKIVDLNTIKYEKAWDLQHELFDRNLQAKALAEPVEQTLLLCEHPHVYTLGRSGVAANLLVDDTFLKTIDAEYFKIDRGGDITYHGYGQLVGYPHLDLEPLGLSLRGYIERLEQTIIDTVAHWGITAGRVEGATGVWLEGDTPRARKIAAIGVRASRYITMHGFALNVNTDLRYFSYINPCGFVDKGVTSMAKEVQHEVDFAEVKRIYTAIFRKEFGL